MRRAIFNTTAFRLSVGYMFLVTLAVAVTLGTAYFLTDGLITDEVDVIIDTELKSLQDRYARTGIPASQTKSTCGSTVGAESAPSTCSSTATSSESPAM